jgi:eukaryotic-like serine/threonine-protein kinase
VADFTLEFALSEGDNMTRFDATDWPVLSSHLDRLLGASPAEQESYLQQLASGSPEVVQQLRRLLASHEQESFAAFLSDSPALAAAAGGSSALLGQQIGPYLLDEEIGYGGMGTVWRAHRTDGRYEGQVAVKLLNRALIGRPTEQRFVREGNILAELRHPNIAYLLDAGVAPHGQPYLVLELVAGHRIDQYCETQALTPRARIRLFLSVLAAVAHAHKHLIIHRDLKPSNILVSGDGVVKLLDFGVAGLLLPENADPNAANTLDIVTALTPEFAAPEQLLNRSLTTATDVYALGLVLFVLLAGRHPHADTGSSIAERLRTVVDQDAPRLSLTANAPATARLLRGDLDNIVAKALRRDPSERYATADAFADDLKRFLTNEPVTARADSLDYRVSKFVARHRGGVATGLVVALGLVSMGIFAVTQMFEARAQRDNAMMEARNANAQGELSEFLLGDSLGQAPNDTVKLKLERAHRLIQRRFGTDKLMQARLLLSLSGRYIDLGAAAGAANLTKEANALAERIDDAHLNADIACGRADDSVDAGDLVTAQRQEVIGYRNMKRLAVVPSGLIAECAMASARIAQLEGDSGKAIDIMRSTLATLEKEGVTRSPRYTSIAHEYARSLVKAGDYRRAWEAEQKVMAIVTETGRDDSSGYYAMINVAATALIFGGQPRQAIALLDQTMARARAASPDWTPPFYLDASRQPLENELERLAAEAEKQGLTTGASIYLASALQSRLGRNDLPAAQAQWQSLNLTETELLANPARWHEAKRVLIEHARLALALDQPANATKLLDQASALDPKAHVIADRDSLRVLLLRAEIAYAGKQYADSERSANTALQLARAQAIDDKSSACIGLALLWRARSEAQNGKSSVAAVTARDALPHLEANLDGQSPLLAVARDLAGKGT